MIDRTPPAAADELLPSRTAIHHREWEISWPSSTPSSSVRWQSEVDAFEEYDFVPA
jgi:hypothetical protein